MALTALSLLVASDRYPLWTLWLAPVAVLIPLTFVWGPRTLPEGRSMGAVLVAEAVLVTGTITVLRGWNGGEAAALGAANVGVAVLLGTALRRAWGNRWYPSTPVELGLGQLATLGAAAWLIVLDGVPGIDPARLSMTDGLWWLANLFVQCSLGLLLVMLPHFPTAERRVPRPPYLLHQLVALTVVTLVAMAVASAHREYPLAWLLLAPALWAGLLLSYRSAVVFMTTAAVALVVLSSGPIVPHGLDDVYGQVIVHAASAAAVATTLLLVILRQMRQEVLDELRRERSDAQALSELQDSVLQSMSDGLLLVDDRGRVLFSNAAAQWVLGTTVPEDPPDSWSRYFGLRTADGLTPLEESEVARIAAVIESGGVDSGDVSLIHPHTGELRVLSVRARGLRSPEGPRALILVRDVTEQRERHEQLLGFAESVAHDLKSPMAGMDMWLRHLDLALASGDLEGGAQSVRWLQRGSAGVGRVIDEWLAFTVTRHSELNPVVISLDRLAEDVVGDAVAAACHRAPEVTLDLPHHVCADHHLARQLLANLVANAIKYTPEERDPCIRIASHDGGSGWVVVEIADQGCGIAPQDREVIFENYVRSNRDAAVADGHGIGLAVCREAVRRHGGWIRAGDNRHGGATFTFTLPSA
ncbi:hypothetical protein K8W59_04245 [Nocardioides rotundus]|uniref:sensor histidine kinase n=1 Tax=Nocardioides rotundus TaxID=1774216 RepID=UPI001CC11710|nr:ATP-binding protein [Nocardioides rotundus]UAL30729.1 hypothetical protein K8W59_04245 [Nocardioides rotundus]